jgi:anaerobic selenocysteine-containing dehydrogenase
MTEEKPTFCRICEVYCGLVATVEDGRITALRPDDDHPVSKGYACPKGLAAHQLTHDPDRVLHPMKKVDGAWQRISWEQAIAEIAAKLDRVRATHGADAVALYTGNPAGYSWNHRIASANWIKAIGSRNSYGAGSQDNLAVFLASKFLYGAFFLRPVPDVERTRFMLIVAANPVISQGTLVHMADAKTKLRQIRERGGKVVVIDPRRTETAKLASEHHFVKPDTDAFLLLAVSHTILGEGLEAKEFLSEHAVGLDKVREVVRPFTPELAAERTGIDAETIRRLAREFAAAHGAVAYGRVVCGRFGTLAAWSLDLLNVLTGNLDSPGGAVFSDGLVDLADVVMKLGLDEYGKHRSRVGDYPGVLGELPAGCLVEEMRTPGPGQVKALVVTAGNPVLSIANGPALADAMSGLEVKVALDIYMSETAALCDYVLPCTTYFERADYPIFHTQLMTEPYAQWTEPVVPPQGEAKSEWDIFALLGDAMGLPFIDNQAAHLVRRAARLFGRDFDPEYILDAMIRLGPYGDRFLPWRKGFTLAEVKQHPHGVMLPPPKTGVLRSKVRTPDKKVHLWNDALAAELARVQAAANGNGEYPLRLIGRRDTRSNNSWLHNLPKLMRGERCRRLRMHPEDARRLGLADEDRAIVRSNVGELEVEVRITDEVMPGVVSLPHGWGHTYDTSRKVAAGDPGPNCNALIDHRVIEPLSGMAFLNGFPVSVEAKRVAAAS